MMETDVSKGTAVLDADGNPIDYFFNQFEKYKRASVSVEAVDEISKYIDNLDLTWEKGLFSSKIEYDPRTRKSDIAWIDDENVSNFVYSQFLSANSDPDWQFNINALENVQYTVYKESEIKESDDFTETLDGHYEWHSDHLMSAGDTRTCRKLSMTFMLSQVNDDYEGGSFEFQLLRNGNIEYDTLTLQKGDILVFPSTLNHRVRPVRSGTRKVLVAWAWGPLFR